MAVSSLTGSGTVEVDVPPTTDSSWNSAPVDALGASAEADEGAAEAAGAEAGRGPIPGKEAQSPSKRTDGIGVDGSPPSRAITTDVWPPELNRMAPPLRPLPDDSNWTKAWGRLDGSRTLGTAGTLGTADAPV
jgi:hypothetical protein